MLCQQNPRVASTTRGTCFLALRQKSSQAILRFIPLANICEVFRAYIGGCYVKSLDQFRVSAFFFRLCLFFAVGIIAVNGFGQAPTAVPAPVPPAVAIPRPSAEEVKIIEDGLEKFLKSADPKVKEINKKYPGMISVKMPPPNSAIVPNLAQFFQRQHQANLEVARKGDIDVLFMGDSITDFWRNAEGAYAGKPVLDKYWGHLKVANFGIAGDTTQGVLYRLQNGEGKGFSPKAVMLMIGTNNTSNNANTAPEIAEGVGAVVLELQKDFPNAKILLLGIFPRGTANDPVRKTIAEINSIISKLNDGKRVYYLDIGAKFLDADGNIPRDIMSDALHPGPKGYEIWAEAVKDKLAELMK